MNIINMSLFTASLALALAAGQASAEAAEVSPAVALSKPADSAATPKSQVKAGAMTMLLIPALPEPSTWALMVIGVGAIGGSLRAKRKMVLSTGA